jgi:hypothetical protein
VFRRAAADLNSGLAAALYLLVAGVDLAVHSKEALVGRRKLAPALKRSAVTFVKLRRAERQKLDRLHRKEGRPRSAILRDGLLLYFTRAANNWPSRNTEP